MAVLNTAARDRKRQGRQGSRNEEQALTICMRLYDTARLSFEQQARTSCYSASCAASKGYIRAYLMPCTRPEPCVTMTAVRKP